jgi:hypothetical protein
MRLEWLQLHFFHAVDSDEQEELEWTLATWLAECSVSNSSLRDSAERHPLCRFRVWPVHGNCDKRDDFGFDVY